LLVAALAHAAATLAILLATWRNTAACWCPLRPPPASRAPRRAAPHLIRRRRA